MKAETPTERQKFMNLRSELFSRAIKEDRVARNILSSISVSKIEQQQRRQELLKSVPQPVSTSQSLSFKVKIPQEKISSITSSFINTVTANQTFLNNLAQSTTLPTSQVQTVLQSLPKNLGQPAINLAQKISDETKIEKERVIRVLKVFTQKVKTDKQLTQQVAQKENLKPEVIENVISSQMPLVAEPEKHIEEMIAVPPSVSIEEYENVKKMWQQQYEKGEVPVSENIKSRQQWVEQDIVFITNTLNKLLSSDPKLHQEGLDDLGYILPIFLVNNLSGEQLIVYLKAKLEAAKMVAEAKKKEEEIVKKLKRKTEEELVEVKAPLKKEKEKTMEMEEEIEVESEKNYKKEVGDING